MIFITTITTIPIIAAKRVSTQRRRNMERCIVGSVCVCHAELPLSENRIPILRKLRPTVEEIIMNNKKSTLTSRSVE